MNEELGWNTIVDILRVFFHIFSLKKIQNITHLFLDVINYYKLINSIVTPESFLIKVLKEGENLVSPFSFKFMDMIE